MVNPVTLEVMRHRLQSIADEMEITLLKSAYSSVVKEGLDASAALFDAQGQTIAQAAERHGASIRQGQVTGFSRRGSRVSGVLLADGQKVSAGMVLLTTGHWTTEIGSWLGCPLPVEPERGQILRLDVSDINRDYAPFYGETYVLPKVDGSVLAGTTRERGIYDNRTTEDGRASIVRRVMAMMPGLSGARLVHAVSGLRPMSEDGLPMLGKLPGWDNAYVAAGHCRWGVLTSALTGRCMAQLMTGEPAEHPLVPFDPARFVSAQ